ncbi:hypothetical protein BD408DRAFT_411860 [Parasitella parasitica]|nr:hypothetical protein BD408DRAFT_411860 [Parasitella parasitica]
MLKPRKRLEKKYLVKLPKEKNEIRARELKHIIHGDLENLKKTIYTHKFHDTYSPKENMLRSF